jgi:hypothetical protein
MIYRYSYKSLKELNCCLYSRKGRKNGKSCQQEERYLTRKQTWYADVVRDCWRTCFVLTLWAHSGTSSLNKAPARRMSQRVSLTLGTERFRCKQETHGTNSTLQSPWEPDKGSASGDPRASTKPEGLLPCLQEPATRHYSDTDQSST